MLFMIFKADVLENGYDEHNGQGIEYFGLYCTSWIWRGLPSSRHSICIEDNMGEHKYIGPIAGIFKMVDLIGKDVYYVNF